MRSALTFDIAALVPDLKPKLTQSLAYLQSHVPAFKALTLIVTRTGDNPRVAKLTLPPDLRDLGCTEEQLNASGFPREVFAHGFPMYDLPASGQAVFRLSDKKGSHPVKLIPGAKGQIHFAHEITKSS